MEGWRGARKRQRKRDLKNKAGGWVWAWARAALGLGQLLVVCWHALVHCHEQRNALPAQSTPIVTRIAAPEPATCPDTDAAADSATQDCGCQLDTNVPPATATTGEEAAAPLSSAAASRGPAEAAAAAPETALALLRALHASFCCTKRSLTWRSVRRLARTRVRISAIRSLVS